MFFQMICLLEISRILMVDIQMLITNEKKMLVLFYGSVLGSLFYDI